MHPILKKLVGTDRRSIGKANEVVKEVLAEPSLFGPLFEGLLSDDPVLRMRCADAIEKITARRPEYLSPYKKRLIHETAGIKQKEVRWHAAQMFSRLVLTPAERRTVAGILSDYLKDTSSIVRTFAMQALADIAGQDRALKPAILRQLAELTRTGSPAMKSRGRKLLAGLKAL